MHTLAELAQHIGADWLGDAEAEIHRAQAFDAAMVGDVTLAADAAYRARVQDCAATAIIIAPPAIESATVNFLIAKHPKLAFARAIQALHHQPYQATGISGDFIQNKDCVLGNELSIHPRVTLGNEVVLGNRVTLHPGVVIGDRCRIGDDTIVYANVTIYEDCEIGNRVIIHAGAVIGAAGFGFVPDEVGTQVKVLQLGRVIIEDDCEIGANCAIDRGGFTDTVLRRGVKLDNLIQVGHNSLIGENTVIAALTGLSGGTTVGRNCTLAGQVGTHQHITIGDRAMILGQAGVTKNIAADTVIGGMAQDYRAWRRSQVLFARLPELQERLKRVEKKLALIADGKSD
ncbi:MAG: UDP-3-O-(3-hydroxymyristoyl)glucosamine N-acyltransferase [Acidobacteria bacterium]|nr:UDP-3-O-(3-hydroxymyristoyl)glucosamine N-acyltransferase [Acidobacteriota bacterium]